MDGCKDGYMDRYMDACMHNSTVNTPTYKQKYLEAGALLVVHGSLQVTADSITSQGTPGSALSRGQVGCGLWLL